MDTDGLSPGAAIAAAAARLGWDGDELADSIQVNRSMAASWLDGSVEPPDRFHRRLEEALDFTPAELAALKGEPPPEQAPPEQAPPEPAPPEPAPPAAPVETPLPPPPPPPPSDPIESPRRVAALGAGQAILDARRRKGWSSNDLAAAIHYRRSEVESWETETKAPWRFAVRAMAEVLDFTPEEADAVEAAAGIERS